MTPFTVHDLHQVSLMLGFGVVLKEFQKMANCMALYGASQSPILSPEPAGMESGFLSGKRAEPCGCGQRNGGSCSVQVWVPSGGVGKWAHSFQRKI